MFPYHAEREECAVRTGIDEVREDECVANLHGTRTSRPNRDELTKRIGYLLEHVTDDEAVYAAWIVLNRAYNRQ